MFQKPFGFSALLLVLTWLSISGCATKAPLENQPIEQKAIDSTEVSMFGKKPVETTKLRIMSWNIKHLGRKGLDYENAARLLKNGDVIALQEIVISTGPAALEKLGKTLEKEIGEKTCEGVTEPTTGPGKERYAFIWIDSKVSLVGKDDKVIPSCPEHALLVELNKVHADQIDREPGQATYEIKGTKKKFTIASVHLVPTAKKPAKEVPYLFDSVKKVEGAMIVVGDFNLGSNNEAFNKARELGFVASFDNVPTSLKMKSRALNEPYDNIWVKNASVAEAKVLNLYLEFPKINQKKIYDSLSDHSAVTAVVGF